MKSNYLAEKHYTITETLGLIDDDDLLGVGLMEEEEEEMTGVVVVVNTNVGFWLPLHLLPQRVHVKRMKGDEKMGRGRERR